MVVKATYTGQVSYEKFYKGMDFLNHDPKITFDEKHDTITLTDKHDPKNRMVINVHDLDVSNSGITGTVTAALVTVGGKDALRLSGLNADASGLVAAVADGTAFYQFINEAVSGDGIGKGDKYDNLFEVGEGGTATIDAGGGDDQVLIWHAKNAIIDGGDGKDTVAFTSFAGDIPDPDVGTNVNLTTGVITNPFGGSVTVSNVENIVGTTKSDVIIGNDDDNVIGDGFFDGGADIIDAKGGNDVVLLGFESAGFSIDGGQGADELRLVMNGASLTLDVSDADHVTSSMGDLDIKGFEIYSINPDYFIGNAVFTFFGSDAAEVVQGATQSNTNGQALVVRDKLNGGGGDDRLYGRGGYDQLFGDAGDDTLVGGEGADAMTGGTGADTYLFLAPGDAVKVGAAHDYVTDFSHSDGDTFDLSAIDADIKDKGNQDFKFIGDADFHNKAGELHYVVFDTYVEIEGDRNGDGTADFFVMAQNISSLAKADFNL